MSILDAYRQLMVKLFKSRQQHGVADDEDAILEKMDVVWQQMSIEERREADALAGSIAAGGLSEEQFIAMSMAEEGNFMPNEQRPASEKKIQITASSLVQTIKALLGIHPSYRCGKERQEISHVHKHLS